MALAVLLCLALAMRTTVGQNECQRGGCYPATGDLLVGREDKLTSTSTCGLNGRTKYCIVSHLTGRQQDKCFWCDSSPEVDRRVDGRRHSHLPKYMVTRSPQQRLQTWWQAENGAEKVTVQLDLEAEFIFTHLILTFKTFRPRAMYIERSWDYGRSWSVYRYYAEKCKRSFPRISTNMQKNIDDVICEERYSGVEPSTQGEVVMKVLDPIIQLHEDPYSLRVQQLLKLTNLKVNLMELHTLGDDIIGDERAVNRKYYHSIYEMVVRGSCSCYGHAEQCIPFAGDPTDVDMVYGKCNCTHNTMGRNCEKCMDGYNDQPWKPAYKEKLHVCKKCNCNGHSRKCHFDVAVYNRTAGVSGGVCDDCAHKTTGRQCEQCMPLYYRDPLKNIFDQDVCQPCDCDPSGSFGGGECETVTGTGQADVAGRCICKRNVGGKRCDTCVDGFWKLLESNPEGCQSCGCNDEGTVAKSRCDQNTGKCRCKRFVTGGTCSKCVERFWNLGSTREGCEQCRCDPGGSYSDVCDQVSGYCACRPNIIGRQCNRVRPGYYYSVLDQIVMEGEQSVPFEGPHKYVRRIRQHNEKKTFSGGGFVQVQQDSKIKFEDVTVPSSGDYNMLIRYENQGRGDWDDLRMKVTRVDGKLLGGGDCPAVQESVRYFFPRMKHGEGAVLVDPSLCLEKGVKYNIQVDFLKFNGGVDSTTLIDSIVLMPNIDDMRMFRGRDGLQRKQAWTRLNCAKYYYRPFAAENVPEECKQLQFSISAEGNDGALACQCNPVGTEAFGASSTLTCTAPGGQCPCKPGVTGRRCDKCRAGYYGFGPQGCQACDCSVVGSHSVFCENLNGQCPCKSNLDGRKCDVCPARHYGFPNCKPCRCSGHSRSCHIRTGRCTTCQDNTAGAHCDRCADGYYGDATKGTPNDCQRCQCPGGSGGLQFASTCQQDRRGQLICIDCLPGYTGRQCETCDDGYFGNPLNTDGKCKKCDCSGNIDPFASGKCDAVNGNCFNCLHNTAGPHCEKCRPGYFGDAKNKTCRRCVCNVEGTDPVKGGVCDPVSGQCPCMKNVAGVQCDACKAGYFDIASGSGCRGCLCDKDGALEQRCNLLDGQCKCRVGFGGRDCSQCEAFYWGNPKALGGCKPCRCNKAGSNSIQCDHVTGECTCKNNVIGRNCDMCAARTSGQMPMCEDCHPCNHDWEDIIAKLEERVKHLGRNESIDASQVKAHKKEVENLRKLIEMIADMLRARKVRPEDVNALREMLVKLRDAMLSEDGRVDVYVTRVKRTQIRNADANAQLDRLQRSVDDMKTELSELMVNATNMVESNVGGALNSTKDSHRRSNLARDKVTDVVENVVKKSKQKRRTMKKEIVQGKTKPISSPTFDAISSETDGLIGNLTEQMKFVEAELKRLNGRLCGRKLDGSSCGGCTDEGCATCGEGCGGVADGVKKLAADALERATVAKGMVESKEVSAKQKLAAVEEAKKAIEEANAANKKASEEASATKKIGEAVQKNITRLIKDIEEFLAAPFRDATESERLARETLALNISLDPDEIRKLADKIKELVKHLTGVDAILNATDADFKLANQLKKEAERAKEFALKTMSKADEVIGKLEDAATSQEDARKLIKKANDTIGIAKGILKEIAEKQAKAKFDDLEPADTRAGELENSIDDVTKILKENRQKLEKAEKEGKKTKSLVDQANKTMTDVRSKYDGAAERMADKKKLVEAVRKRVKELQKKTKTLFGNSELKLKQLVDLSVKYKVNEKRIADLHEEIQKMIVRGEIVRDRLDILYKCHSSCNPEFPQSRFCVQLKGV